MKSDDRAANLAAYGDPDLPLASGLADVIDQSVAAGATDVQGVTFDVSDGGGTIHTAAQISGNH